ncbi:hypothetical protein MCOR25_004920 [Pyricularia grisea]|nr:hypothetical protein MCOR25_004920 [Pyricularia grisea]
MWLINTTTFKFESLQPESSRYATLSHTWEDGEIPFQDWSLREAVGFDSTVFDFRGVMDTNAPTQE